MFDPRSLLKISNFIMSTGENQMRKTIYAAICCLAAMAMTTSSASAQLGLGDTIGIDFASPAAVFPDSPPATSPPAAGTNFNAFDIQTDEDPVGVDENGDPDPTDTLDQSASLAAGTLIRILDGATVSGVGFSVTNNAGKESGLTGVASQAGPAPFDDATIGDDNYGAANVGNLARADGGLLAVEDLDAGIAEANFVLTFSGLDDSLAYTVSGGYLHSPANDNFNLIFDADGSSATTLNTSGLPDAGYVTLTNLSTDGSGNLEITVTRALVQLLISGVTIEATAAGEDCLLGDVDLNGSVEFLDINPFIDVLSSNGFQCEADIDEDGMVTFLDIQPFITILANQ